MLENSSPGGFSSCLIKHSCLSFSRNPENSENQIFTVCLIWNGNLQDVQDWNCPVCLQILFSKNVSFLRHQRHKKRYSIYDDCYQTRFPKLSFAFRWTHDWKRLPLKNIYRGFSVKKVFLKMSV